MGRANQKPRKGADHHHLPKVGTSDDIAREAAAERSAVLDVMGLGTMSPTARKAVALIGTLLLIAAIVALIILTFL